MEDELIKHIKERLADHELDYRPGAWENFKKPEKQQRPNVFWLRLAGIAAMLIFAISFFLINHESPEFKKDNRQKLSVSAHHNQLPVPVKDQKGVNKKELFYAAKNKPAKSVTDTPFRAATLNNAKGIIVFYRDLTMHHLTNSEIFTVTQIARPEPIDISTTTDQRLAVQRKPVFNRDKWRLSLSMGQAKSNGESNQFGLGAFVSYQLSNKFELSSGFYFNQLGAQKDIGQRPMPNEIGKYLVNVRSNLAGLEIPLELKYKLTNSLYSKVGFSVYSITSQQQILLFNQEKIGVVNYVDAGGTAYSETVSTTEARTIEVPKSKLGQNKFVGLYNISVGFEPRIFNKQKLAFEPFLKIPVGDFSSYKLNLSQIGLRINVGF